MTPMSVHDSKVLAIAELRTPLGITTRRHPVSSPADLQLDGRNLRHVPTGKKIASLGFGVHASDVEQLRAQVLGPAA